MVVHDDWAEDAGPLLSFLDTEQTRGRDADKLDRARNIVLQRHMHAFTPAAVDKLTIVMPGFSRRQLLLDALQYYCESLGSDLLDQIIVVWNNQV